MKKILCAILLLGMLLSFCSCQVQPNDERLPTIYVDGYIYIYVDNETGVQYLINREGGICVMVDENGDPLIHQKPMEGGE